MGKITVLRKTKEKRKKILLTSTCGVAAALGSVGIAVSAMFIRPSAPPIIEAPPPPPPPLPTIKQFKLRKESLDKLTKQSIQKSIIDNNKLEADQFDETMIHRYVNKTLNSNVVFDVSFVKQETKVFLKVAIPTAEQENLRFSFLDPNTDPSKYFLGDNDTSLYILFGENGSESLQFFERHTITNTKAGFDALEQEVWKTGNKYTLNEFINNFDTCLEEFYKPLVNFDKGFIKGKPIFDSKSKTIQISLDTNYKKYVFENYGNRVIFDSRNSRIIIGNIQFYSEIEIGVDANNVPEIQKLIDNKKHTKTELQNDTRGLRQVVNSIFTGINPSNIANIELDAGDNVVVTLSKPNNLKKYKIPKNLPDHVTCVTEIVDGDLIPKFTFSNLTYYTQHKISNTVEAHTALLNSIDSKENRFTKNVFKDNLKTNMQPFYKLLKVDDNAIPENLILNQTFNDDQNNVTIQLDKNYKKYIIENNDIEATLDEDNSTLTIDELSFYTQTNLVIKENLKTFVQGFISDAERKYTINEFKNTSNLIELKNKVITNIDGLSNELIDEFKVDDNNNLVITLKIPQDEPKTKYSISGELSGVKIEEIQNQSQAWTYKLTIENLDYFTEYNITDTTTAFNTLQSEIDKVTNRYTVDEFNAKLADETSKNEIMSKIYSSLKMNDTTFDSTNTEVAFNKDEKQLNIRLDRNLKKYTIEKNDNITLDAYGTTIEIKNIEFFTSNAITVTDNFKNELQKFISGNTRKYTKEEFNTNLEDNKDSIKEIASNAINGLEQSNIVDVKFENDVLQLDLANTDHHKYTVDTASLPDWITYTDYSDSNQTPNFKISNLQFFTQYEITGAENAFNALNTEISKWENRYTASEFNTNITTCLDTFYSGLTGFDKTWINGTPTFNEDSKTVSININQEYKKYTFTEYEINGTKKVAFDQANSIITIRNIDSFFSETELTVEDDLFSTVQNFIKESNRKYTAQEFRNMSNEPDNQVKKLIGNKINGLSWFFINKVENTDNQITITLESIDKKKWSIKNNIENISGSYNDQHQFQITISNIRFFTTTKMFDEETTGNLRENPLNVNSRTHFVSINSNLDTFNRNINLYRDPIKNHVTTTNVPIRNLINSDNDIRRVGDRIEVHLNQNLIHGEYIKPQKQKFASGNVTFDDLNNVLSFNNLEFKSPDSYFGWNGNYLDSLSNDAKRDPDLFLPSRTENMRSTLVYNNNTQTKNLALPFNQTFANNYSHIDSWGWFCVNDKLEYVKVPSLIKILQKNAFKNCYNLNKVSWFDHGFTEIREWAFQNTKLPGDIVLPRVLQTIKTQSFGFYADYAQNNPCNETKSITTWATTFESWFLTRRKGLQRINLLCDSLNSSNVNVNAFNDMFSTPDIYVKNEQVASVIRKCNGIWNVIVDPDLESNLGLS